MLVGTTIRASKPKFGIKRPRHIEASHFGAVGQVYIFPESLRSSATYLSKYREQSIVVDLIATFLARDLSHDRRFTGTIFRARLCRLASRFHASWPSTKSLSQIFDQNARAG